MTPNSSFATLDREEPVSHEEAPRWVIHAGLLWQHRRMLARVAFISLILSLATAFVIPKQYKSSTSIMPPDQQSASTMMLAALSGHLGSLGALGDLAGGLGMGHSSSELFIDLLHSGTVSDHLIDRFNLQHVYHKRYRIDAAKHLARLTKITENKKTGVVTIEVEDTDRERAREIAQAYLDELNLLVTRTSTSAAHRERVFIEQRLHEVKGNLEEAELQLSQFSSDSSAIDIKEQTRAMVDAGARVQAELMVEQSGLQSLRQIYGDGNVRVRESEARISSLQGQLAKMTGSSEPAYASGAVDTGTGADPKPMIAALYPPLRQLPRLAVPFADLYRRVQVQEAVFQLLTQQYETARIEEAKDVPAVNVIDPPGLPEKKSFPPRLLLTLLLSLFSFASVSTFVLLRHYWSTMACSDPRRKLADQVLPVLRHRVRSILPFQRGAA
ncbi:Lipopolysaccharide biosynthesis protein [Candidatus Sulfotelmatomonas gaucii]|uniref:Lipopolysaccharide biosynthesis protein n=1 Tax=Candidatus Sulfuritelmatomonas gaucii TaxID=2043161 RepID=A0A2N9LX35_9BACT|nr:Lipopolysaccharide biosynthesis protein [Candidatus Sulfotelmatomonas gaucii]